MATGKQFLGLNVSGAPLRVLYLDMEMGEAGFRSHMAAVARMMGCERGEKPPGLTLMSEGMDPVPFGLSLSPGDQRMSDAGTSILRTLLERLQPDITICEPLLDLFGRGNLNSPVDVNIFMRTLRSLPTQWILAHHEAKSLCTDDGGRKKSQDRMAGSMALAKQADRTLSIQPGKQERWDGYKRVDVKKVEWGKVRGWVKPADFEYYQGQRDDGRLDIGILP